MAARRRKANRESAARVRLKRQQLVDDLEVQVCAILAVTLVLTRLPAADSDFDMALIPSSGWVGRRPLSHPAISSCVISTSVDVPRWIRLSTLCNPLMLRPPS